jgi:glutamate dehydrogenase
MSDNSPENRALPTANGDLPADLAQIFTDLLQDAALPGEGDGLSRDALQDVAQFLGKAAQQRGADAPAIVLDFGHGEGRDRRMWLAVVNDDMPFLVDTISQIAAAQNLIIDRLLHPLAYVERDSAGHLLSIAADKGTGGQGQRESLIFMELERVDARARRQFSDAVQVSLGDVRAAVCDWKAMRAEMLSDAAMRLDGEAAELLRWFESGAMLLLGHEWRSRDGGRDKPLGISAASHGALLSKAGLEAAFSWFDQGCEAPLLIKSNRLSTVHRFVMLDLIIVPEMVDGKAARLSVHAGLWTSAALSVRPDKVPMLRAELAALMHKFGFDPTGHAGKSLSHTLTALPHDILIAFRAQELEHLVLTSMSITDRPRPRIEMVRSALGRHLFAFVWLPRDEVSTLRRQAVQQMLIDAAKATLIGWSMVLEDGGSAMLRFTLDLGRDGIEPDRDTLNDALEQLVRGWVPKVEAALAGQGDAGRAAALASRFAAEFPDHYRSRYGAEEAAQDILRLHGLSDAHGRSVRLAQSSLDGDDRLRLKVYSATGPIPLSDIVPAMEHFGFQVLQDVPTALNRPRDGGAHGDARLYIHDFLLKNPPAIDEKALLPHVQMIEDAIAAVLTGQQEDDSFNQLVLFTQQEPQTISWLRAWFRFLRQGGFLYGMDTVVGALRSAPQLTNKLISLFRALHDPKAADEAKAAQLQQEIEAAFADIQSIDEDRIFRLYLAVINATLRTNAFAPAAEEALAFKLDSSLIPGLPKPLPWREVFVYSQRVEGVHMRAGPVARGGLRWSDRRDDFRTEVLGLMKAQRVKNAVIVPTGAKGGFYAKNLPSPSVDRDAWFAEGTECYRIFIRSLLSVTDNIVAGKVLHPKGVTIRDGEDPYFVVAADKGTATFSDVANALAMERDFWLGDAFASGGSKGYDHKAMGITARGAWLSVQRHFAELGVDVQTQPIEVVGCGDMSGDVFGNGMLLSKAIKLVAAYDHRHIFLDPNPDPETSWSERKRLFELPRSSWDDYDKGLISAGGGVFPRSQKIIPLSPEVREILGIEAESLDPSALISAILKSPADLLWFGGIGTYLKAASQNNADVGDPANDAVRVDAEDLRVQVVGEGANLGVTQAARIAFAAQGGRINADFIDNSAGVDCSDNEVNIKIALNGEMAEGRLAQADRDSLLVRMTDDVARLVLEDNRLQALALSIAERSAQSALPSLLRVMDGFEAGGRLDRKVEGLASNEDYLRRAAEGGGLTRPELAILMSTTKLALQEAIEDSSLPDDPALTDDLAAAFPDEMQRDFADAIQQHQLRREIIATKIANRMVNRLGVIHPQELMEEEGCSLADVAAAFVAVEDIADMRRLWAELDAAPMGEDARLNLFHQAGTGMASLMSEYLRLQSRETPSQAIARLKPSVSEVAAKVKELISGAADVQWSRLEKGLVESGAPAALAADVARLYKLDGALSVAHLAQQQGDDVTVLARAFTTMSEALGLDWAQSAAAQMSPADPWERLLVNGLARDFQQILLGFLSKLPADQLQQSVHSWLGDNAARVAIFRATVEKAQRLPSPNGAILSHIAGQARGLLAR